MLKKILQHELSEAFIIGLAALIFSAVFLGGYFTHLLHTKL